jgi:hypothetical protein
LRAGMVTVYSSLSSGVTVRAMALGSTGILYGAEGNNYVSAINTIGEDFNGVSCGIVVQKC